MGIWWWLLRHCALAAVVAGALAQMAECAPVPPAPRMQGQASAGVVSGGLYTTMWRGREVSYEVIDGWAVHDGDIVLGSVDEVLSGRSRQNLGKSAVWPGSMRQDAGIPRSSYEDYLWPGGVIPYVIAEGFPELQRKNIEKAIQEWNERTVIELLERTTEGFFVQFQVGNGCHAQLGRGASGGGITNVWLGASCSLPSILHEIGHAVGLGHEHQRYDRTDYLDVSFDPPSDASSIASSFYLQNVSSRIFNVGPYDFRSVMHYSRWGVNLSRFASFETIPPGIPIGNASAPWLSEGDIDGIARLYGLPPKTAVIATNPPGLEIVVDGSRVSTPITFDWTPGSVHTLEAPLQQAGWVFARWNVGGARVRQVVASPDTTWFEANFMSVSAGRADPLSGEDATEFRLFTAVSGTGSVVADPPSDDGYYAAGTRVELSAEPGNDSWRFRSWEGTATSYEATTWVEMDGPKVALLHLEPTHRSDRILEANPRALQEFSTIHSDSPRETVRLTNHSVRSWRYGIASGQSWLTASPAEGRLAGGESVEIAVRLLTEGLPPGRYAGRLQVVPVREEDDERKVLELAAVPVELVVADEPGAAERWTVRLGESGESVELIHLGSRGFLHSSGRPLIDGNRISALNGDVFSLSKGPGGVVATYVPRTQTLALSEGVEVTLVKDREGEGEEKWRIGSQRVRYGHSVVRGDREYFLDLLDGSWQQSRYLVRTVVGNSEVVDGIAAVAASFYEPRDVATDAAGNVYVADSQNRRLRRIDRSGTITTVAGTGEFGHSGDGGPATEAQFREPISVAVDRADNIYVVDRDRVRKIDGLGIVTTLAGTGESGHSGDGGPAIEAQLLSSRAVAADGAGNVYVAEHHRVRKIDAAGTITTLAGSGECCEIGDGGPAGAAWLTVPSDVAVDGLGNVYVADDAQDRVRKIDAAGTITTLAGTGEEGYTGDEGPAIEAQIDNPSGVAVDGEGNVYVTVGNRVRKIDAAGTITTVAGTGRYGRDGDGGPATEASLYAPGGVATDGRGSLYFVDRSGHRVRQIDASGTIRTIAGTGSWKDPNGGTITKSTSHRLRYPRSVGFGVSGEVFFIDYRRVWRLDAAGQVSAFAGTGRFGYSGDGGPATEADLSVPVGLAVDSLGNVYIADSENQRVRKIDVAGTITTVAGTGRYGFTGDAGPATEADLSYPRELTVDPAGNLYILTGGRVRKVDPAGTITTLADPDGLLLGIAVDAPGNVYFIQYQDLFSLSKIEESGDTSQVIFSPERLNGIATDDAGSVYLGLEHRIVKVDVAQEEWSVVAGTGEGGFRGDRGPAASARLSVATDGIAVDRDGRVWFADRDSRRIRVVEPVTAGN